MKVLIVDDSVVMRSQIKSSLDGVDFIEVVGAANNGKIALQRLEQITVEAVILDMEMPELNGIETIKAIRKAKYPVRILVFSALTTSGSMATLDALSAGADDFIAKPSGPGMSLENAVEKIREQIVPKLNQFLNEKEKLSLKQKVESPEGSFSEQTFAKKDLSNFIPSLIVIGSSTGGPPAIEKVLSDLPKTLRVPILIAQHMPPVFTASFAKRLGQITGIECEEGRDGEILNNNKIYIAPGDFHMSLVKVSNQVQIKLDKTPHRNSVRPAVDPLFETAANLYGPKTLAIVLTGMGEDGLVGARAIKSENGAVAIQNKESCVVFGMPGAINAAQLQDAEGDLTFINHLVKRVTS
ncbi:MAG: chemotaxis-specific protein-glutamate methyltransferase CheB [Bacteriovoracaceae bacterium]|nr:chemotaxis-specific protein-glutamate methyltransferase CheB [Bacteriovoracaceae bacterium]